VSVDHMLLDVLQQHLVHCMSPRQAQFTKTGRDATAGAGPSTECGPTEACRLLMLAAAGSQLQGNLEADVTVG
jgi:hypothetical protein